jgi:threonine/homoserine/homoserine lactone efflux protein
MAFDVWLALCGLFLAGGLTPGPAVMLVVASALNHGFRAAMLPALGITAANLGWIALAVSGAGVLATQFPQGFLVLKLAGLAFIIWIAIGLVRNPPRRFDARGKAGGAEAPQKPGALKLFLSGVGLQLGNPNALVYFGALLPGYVDLSRPLAMQVAVMVATISVLEMFGLSVYAAASDGLARRFADARFARAFAWGAALVMVGSAAYAVVSTL